MHSDGSFCVELLFGSKIIIAENDARTKDARLIAAIIIHTSRCHEKTVRQIPSSKLTLSGFSRTYSGLRQSNCGASLRTDLEEFKVSMIAERFKGCAKLGAVNAARAMSLGLKYAKASVLYLATGSTLVLLNFLQVISFYMFAFYFMELYGFVASMIFGVSYLLIPAFAHRPLHSVSLAEAQFWLFNIGTIGLTMGFSGLVTGSWVAAVQAAALLFQVVAVYMHAYNIWMTAGGWKGSTGEAITQIERS